MYDPAKPYKEKIIKKIKSTWSKNVIEVGPYSMIKKNRKYYMLHTDGVGTKGTLHYQMGTFGAAAIDACAMNINDVLLTGAKPLFLEDHIMIEREDNDAIEEIIESLVKVCNDYKISLVGGETAIMDTVKGLEIGATVVAYASKKRVLTPHIEKGDVIIGLASSGIHSNGFSFVRKILSKDNGVSLEDRFGEDTLGEELTKPTMIYEKPVRKLLKHNFKSIHGMVHVTGGAYTKIKDFIGKNVDVIIDKPMEPQPIFYLLYKKGELSSREMYKTFNCGMGFLLFVEKNKAEKILRNLKNDTPSCSIVGKVTKGSGRIRIKSWLLLFYHQNFLNQVLKQRKK